MLAPRIVIVALLIAPTGAAIITPMGKAYAAFQESHGDLDMCNPAKVAILMESLGLSAKDANKFSSMAACCA